MTRRTARIRLWTLLSCLPVVACTYVASWFTGATQFLSTVAAIHIAVALMTLIRVLEAR